MKAAHTHPTSTMKRSRRSRRRLNVSAMSSMRAPTSTGLSQRYWRIVNVTQMMPCQRSAARDLPTNSKSSWSRNTRSSLTGRTGATWTSSPSALNYPGARSISGTGTVRKRIFRCRRQIRCLQQWLAQLHLMALANQRSGWPRSDPRCIATSYASILRASMRRRISMNKKKTMIANRI